MYPEKLCVNKKKNVIYKETFIFLTFLFPFKNFCNNTQMQLKITTRKTIT